VSSTVAAPSMSAAAPRQPAAATPAEAIAAAIATIVSAGGGGAAGPPPSVRSTRPAGTAAAATMIKPELLSAADCRPRGGGGGGGEGGEDVGAELRRTIDTLLAKKAHVRPRLKEEVSISFEIQAAAAAAAAAPAAVGGGGVGGGGGRPLLSALLVEVREAAARNREMMKQHNCGATWFTNLWSYYVKESCKEAGGEGWEGGRMDVVMARQAFERRKTEMGDKKRECESLIRGGGAVAIGTVAWAAVQVAIGKVMEKAMRDAQKLRNMSRKLVLGDSVAEDVQLAIEVEQYLETGCGGFLV